MGSTKSLICSRKFGFAVFVVLFLAVIGLTVWLGIWSANQVKLLAENEAASKKGGTSGKTTDGKKTDEEDDKKEPDTKEDEFKQGTYRFAAVAADNEHCSNIGTVIMAKEGGSAVDAAIATLLCIGVLNADSSGIGGGGFMVVYNREKKTATTFDFREEAPAGSTKDMFKGKSELSTKGGLAIGVPGEIKGFWTAHQKYGRVPWKKLFQPAIELCEDGFPLGFALAKALKAKEAVVKADKQLSEVFLGKDGELLKEGDMTYRKRLGKTLEILAEEGANAYYNGSLSQDIVDDVKERGGIITLQDLLNYQVNEKPPIKVDVKGGLNFYSLRPPSSGVIIGLILNILDGYNMTADLIKKDPALVYHRVTEAFKFAYGKRTELGDEDFVDIKEFIGNLTKKSFAERIRNKIWDNQTHPLEYYEPTFLNRMDAGTSHLSILAPNGDAVAVTSTINTALGSTVRGNKTGILFNNEMDDFSSPNITNAWGVQPSPANFIQPGKRPMSSMSPSIFVDANGDVKLVAGGSGGTKIITTTVLTALRTLWFGSDIKQAIDGRRIHHQLLPPYLQYEGGFPKDVVEGLKQRGHEVREYPPASGNACQGVLVKDKHVTAYSDFRKQGRPDGY